MKSRVVVCFIFAVLMLFADYADTTTINGITWTYFVTDGYVTIGTRYATGSAVTTSITGNITIPTTINNLPVKKIGDFAFKNCSGLTRVAIPNCVNSIGWGAFGGCSGLTGITIPIGVASIGDSAFSGCSGLTGISIPSSVSDIGDGAFYGCTGLTSVSIANGVINIGRDAFYGCSEVTSIIIPDSVTYVGREAFRGCSSLTSVKIGSGLMSIGDMAFHGCCSLNAFTVSQNNANYKSVNGLLLTKNGGVLVSGINGTVSMPGGVTKIEAFAFHSRTQLVSIAMPESLGDIGKYAFYGCVGLKNLTIPNSVTNVGMCAFYGCKGLAERGLVVVRNIVFWFNGQGDVTIPNGVTRISDYAFEDCSKVTRVTMPNSVVDIGKGAFENCKGLIRIDMSNSIVNVGDFAFSGCSGLDSIEMCNSMTNIGNYAFHGCTRLASIVVPNSVVSLGSDAFSSCGLNSVKLGSSITSIGGMAFYSCAKLVEVIIPDSVTTIGGSAFYNCPKLERVFLSKGYTGSISAFPSGVSILRYKPNQVVTFDAGDGQCSYESSIVHFGSTYGALPVAYLTGYAFSGWIYDGQVISNEAVVSAIDDHILVARWTPERFVQVFNDCGGDGGLIVTQSYGTALSPPVVTRTGYEFLIWDPKVPAKVPASNATYVAQWQINKYTISFNANGGSGGWSRLHDYGSVIDAPSVTRTGCTFEGWLPSPDATVPDHDVTYVAQWKIWDVTVASASSKMKELYPDDYQRITNIVIEASVASLPDNFFDGCDALEKVTFISPDTELGNNDLRKVGKLFANQPDGYWIVQGVLLGYKGVCPRKIPNLDAVKRVFDGALEGCTALEELTFTAESVLTAIGTNAFKHCTELRQMTLPPSLTEIGDEAFMGCSYLGNVIVPGRVKRVGNRAFKNCTGFTAAQIEYGVESLGEEAFCGDWRISEVDIPSTVTNIGVNAFGGDSSIIRIGLRGDVRKASEIFSNYKFIRAATVKEGTGEVVDGLFSGFEKLRDVRFFGNCPQLENEGQLLYAMTPGKSDDNAGLTTYVEANSTGWDGTPGSHSLPQAWPLAGGSRRAIAYWDAPSYLCQFESNGGTLGVQDTYQYSEKPFVLPPEPVQSGYKFAGWWTKPVGGLHVTSDTIFIEGVYTMLYAHWIKGHWVFLDPNGGTVVNDYITYVEETTYGVLPSPVRSGYAFNGWLYNDIVIVPTTVISDKNDHTLVAQWTANLYSVRYHANGGVGNMADEFRTYGVEQALRKNIFVNDGYIFAGWATNETDEIIYSDCEIVSNMTAIANGWMDLYAVWEENDITPDPSNLNFYFSGDANWERCAEGVEVEKDGETVRFDSVWKSGFVTNNQASVLAADVYGAGKIGFWWKVSCESFRNWKLDNLEFAIDGVPQEPWINGETDWQYLEFEVNEMGSHTLTWTYSKDESDDGIDVGEDCGRVTAAVWTPSLVTLGDYVNCPRLEFRSSGDAEWAGDLQVSHDGIASLRSGEISHNSTTKVELDVDGEGRIGFWWKVSSEAFRQLPIDYVSFKIDGIEQAWIGGEVDWTNVAFNVVGDGTHTLSWEYHKDSEGSAGEDCAWIDEIVWVPSGGTIPELSLAQAAAWVSNDLATRYAKSGESAADYKSRFEAKFGADPVAAMAMPTDKKDAQGNDMYVWQDYVAGTDPTDTNSVFTATIKMVDGAPVVEWSPKLGAAEEAQRRYTIYGKTNLTDKAWHSPTNALDRFFTVGVEMR